MLTLFGAEFLAQFGHLDLVGVVLCQLGGLSAHILPEFVLHQLVAVEPLVCLEALEGGPAIGLGAEEGVDEPLEGVGEEALGLVALVHGPEALEVLVSDELVDAVVGLGAEEGRSSVVHDEEHHTGREDICLDALVVALLHFWGFVALSPYPGAQLAVS